jgi:hypothetical protein
MIVMADLPRFWDRLPGLGTKIKENPCLEQREQRLQPTAQVVNT